MGVRKDDDLSSNHHPVDNRLGRTSEAAEAMARSDWKKMGARSEDEALGIYLSIHAQRAPPLAGSWLAGWLGQAA